MVGKRKNKNTSYAPTRTNEPLAPPPSVAKNPDSNVKTLARITACAVIVALAAVVFSLITVGGSQGELSAMKATSANAVIAKTPIPKNTVITEDLVETTTVPTTYIEEQCATATQEVVGKTTLTAIAAKGQIGSNDVAGPANTSSLAATVETDWFAASVSVDAETGLGGLLLQGDYVDVLAGGRPIMENVRVIALDASLAEPLSEYSTVTLQVSRADAEALQVAQFDDPVRLVLHAAAQGRS
ncbi:MAG: Flp pilus assembly protein CpaB [Raoultibacter sp.]